MGSSASSPGSPRTIVSGRARSCRNGKRALANCRSTSRHRGTPPPGRCTAPDGLEHAVAERSELADRGVLLRRRAHLELGVARDRDAHQAHDHVGEMRRLASLLAVLGSAAARRSGPEPGEPRGTAPAVDGVAAGSRVRSEACGTRSGSRRSRGRPGCRTRARAGSSAPSLRPCRSRRRPEAGGRAR